MCDHIYYNTFVSIVFVSVDMDFFGYFFLLIFIYLFIYSIHITRAEQLGIYVEELSKRRLENLTYIQKAHEGKYVFFITLYYY